MQLPLLIFASSATQKGEVLAAEALLEVLPPLLLLLLPLPPLPFPPD